MTGTVGRVQGAAHELGAPQRVLARLRAHLPSLQAADQRVVNVVLEQPDLVIYKSVAEVAELAGTSSATVVRSRPEGGLQGIPRPQARAGRRALRVPARPGRRRRRRDGSPRDRAAAGHPRGSGDRARRRRADRSRGVRGGGGDARRGAAPAVRRRRHLGAAVPGRRLPLQRDRRRGGGPGRRPRAARAGVPARPRRRLRRREPHGLDTRVVAGRPRRPRRRSRRRSRSRASPARR